ncbi:MAG: class II aldolase/adducin family protein [Gammaproteobacteria bacterium]|nr:class II aldolase/adducin family protein [Gammaproteobacteria bacterium]
MNATAEKPVRDRVSEQEWNTRVDLAACYRLIAAHGWDDLIFTHVSARVPGPDEHFLINAYGMLFEEMTASSLVKVDLQGNKVDDSHHPVNPAGFVIHSAIHEARPDVACIIHTHTTSGVAVSIQPEGLRPLSQTALFPYCSVGYHDYEGVALLDDEKPRLVADLGDHSNLILRNHGLLTAAGSIPDAFLQIFVLEKACEIQIKAQTGNNLIEVDQRIQSGMLAQAKEVTKGLGGDLAWPALLRKLDRMDSSFRN